MLVGIVGTAMTSAYLATLGDVSEITMEFDQARVIGCVLFAVSNAITIYHIVSSKILSPPQ